MPKENRKRGRREEEKRKRGEHEPGQANRSKRARSEVKPMSGIVHSGAEQSHTLPEQDQTRPGELPFYGLLDEDEQSYFKRVDTVLELNQFDNAGGRDLFIANVYREANGKELKLASSQSCSRFMERLIQLSTPSRLKTLFQKFSGHFLNLVQHRFASHCCEALFIQSAPVVSQEMVDHLDEKESEEDSKEIYVSMENLFLYTINELDGNLGYLMTDHFASHTLRVLLVVLSGWPLAGTLAASLLQSKRKESVDVAGQVRQTPALGLVLRTVPESFKDTLDKVVSGTIAGLDTNFLRALATHPIGNPVLQLLLALELSQSGKVKARDEKSLFRRLLPDDALLEGTTSASFLKGLLFDPVGSRLMEALIQFAPGKEFKAIYRAIFHEKFLSLVKNEAASFVVARVMERLNAEDLRSTAEEICPVISLLMERSRTSTIKTLIERCVVRGVDTQPIADALVSNEEGNRLNVLLRMLKLHNTDGEALSHQRKAQLDAQDVGKLHGSLLAQSMLEAPGPLRDLVMDALLDMKTPILLETAKDRSATYVVQRTLTCTGKTQALRRKIIQKLMVHITELALDPIASHVVDIFWSATRDLVFMRERIAAELKQSEPALRESFSGRAVWRNWMMDLYTRRKIDWISRAKDAEDLRDSIRSSTSLKDEHSGRSRIELARKRHAAVKAGQTAKADLDRSHLTSSLTQTGTKRQWNGRNFNISEEILGEGKYFSA